MISTIKEYLEEGNNTCPFSRSCTTHYVIDSDDFRPAFRALKGGQAVVIESSYKGDLTEFEATKKWARSTFLKALAHATSVSNPNLSDYNIWTYIDNVIAPILNNDSSTIHVGLALCGEPMVTICMSPTYPIHHPRYAPNAILVLVNLFDVDEAGALNKVRESMLKEHGSIYDAMELILPLPAEKLVN